MTLRPRILLSAVLACLLAATASAQTPVVDLLPDDSAVIVTLQHGGEWPQEVVPELREVGWSTAGDTFRKLLRSLDEDPGEMDEVIGMLDDLSPAELLEEMCSGLPAALGIAGGPWQEGFEFALGVGVNLASPPVTAALRLGGAEGIDTAAVHSALEACASDVREGGLAGPEGTRLYEFGEVYAPWFVAVADDGLIVLGSDPLPVAAVLQRNEAAAPAAALLPFEPLAGEAFSFGLLLRTDPARQLVTLLLQESGAQAGPYGVLAQRLRGAVETIDSLGFRLSIDGQGVLQEGHLGVSPDAPDRELARLVTCEGCRAARPYLAPADAVSVSSLPLPLGALVEYANGIFAQQGAPTVTEMLLQETGIDLQRDLLDWVGRDMYHVQVENLDTDLRTLIYQPAQALVFPVSDSSRAQAGLERLLDAVQTAWLEAETPGLAVALRDGSYRDIDYRRFQASLNLDFAVGLVGQNLVIAMPAHAIEDIIDVYHGAPSITGERHYRDAQAAAPSGPAALSWTDTPDLLLGLASIARLGAQPLAFFADIGLAEMQSSELVTTRHWQVEFDTSQAQPLQAGSEVQASLADPSDPAAVPDVRVDGFLSDVYRLEGAEPGDTVTVVMQSGDFDTYLYLLDGEGWIRAMNDDAPDTTRSEFSFIVEAGTDYYIQATSWGGESTGDYTLATSAVSPGEPAEEPSFAELLDLFEMPARILEALAHGVGDTTGYAVSGEEALYSRTFTPFVR